MKSVKKLRIKEISLLIFVLFCVYFNYDSGIREYRYSKEIVVIIPFIIVLITFITMIVLKKINLRSREVFFLIFILSFIFVTTIINNDYAASMYITISKIILAFMFVHILRFEEFSEVYIKVIKILAIFSLVGICLMPFIMNGIINIFPTAHTMYDVPIVDMGFSFCVRYFGIPRNMGIFREPGVYQFFILVALVFELYFVKRKVKKSNIVLFVITIISTLSVIGILLMLIIINAWLLFKVKITIYKWILWIIFLLGSSMVVYYIFPDIWQELSGIFNKLNTSEDNMSLLVRKESIFNSVKMSTEKMIFGFGLNNGLQNLVHNYNSYGTVDVTGTLVLLSALIGWPCTLIINFSLLSFCFRIKLTKYRYIISVIIFMVLFTSVNSQNFIYNDLLWIMLFYGASNISWGKGQLGLGYSDENKQYKETR